MGLNKKATPDCLLRKIPLPQRYRFKVKGSNTRQKGSQGRILIREIFDFRIKNTVRVKTGYDLVIQGQFSKDI